VVDGVAAATANANDFNYRGLFFGQIEMNHNFCFVLLRVKQQRVMIFWWTDGELMSDE
jgi:hypothetical protein